MLTLAANKVFNKETLNDYGSRATACRLIWPGMGGIGPENT
jgi:hypothetical protein